MSSGRGNNNGAMTLYARQPSESFGVDENDDDDCQCTTRTTEDNYSENDDDDDLRRTTRTTEGNYMIETGLEWDDGMNLTLGQEFGTKREMQDIIERGAHKNCFEYVIMKSDKTRYVLKCCEWKNGCKWALRAAKLNNSNCFSVRTYCKKHSCSRSTTSTSSNRRKGTTRLVASVVHEDYPGRFDTPNPKNLIRMVHARLGVQVSYSTAWRGKKQASNDVRGSPEESYMMVYSYLYMLEKVNPGTVSCVELDEEHRFKYLFFALGACIEGFQAMRKVLIVDGTHLKTEHGGVLLVVTAQDPDHHHYPIAFGVVDGEKDASWGWFFNMLKGVIADSHELVFLSDRNQSLIKAISEVYPLSQHGYCNYHLSQNLKSRCSNVNKETVAAKFRECAKVYTETEFLRLYDAFRKKYPSAAEYLDSSVVEGRWARCYFPGDRYNIDSTNCVESINGVFRDARKYSLLPMIDAIVAKLAEWFNKYRKRSVEVSPAQKLVPFVEEVMHTRCAEAKLLTVHEINSHLLQFTVIGLDGKTYLVDLRMKTCSCKYFDIDKYPCVHGIAAGIKAEIELHDLCSMYYFVEQWALAYCRTIYPVPHMSEWSVPTEIKELYALPPKYMKKKGRRQQRRFPSVGEHRGRRGRLHTWFQSESSRC